MKCFYESPFIIFLALGMGEIFFGSTMPFIRQDYKLHSLINPIFKKKKFESVDFSSSLQIVFFWGGRFILASNNNIIHCNTLAG